MHQLRTFATPLLATGLALTLAACGSMPQNRSLYSVNQPVVERTNYAFDVRTGSGGLSTDERARLDAWFAALDLGYGDRVAIDDPSATQATREAVAALAARRGVALAGEAPVTPGYVEPGTARIVLTRSIASVPGCPDWSVKTETNWTNGVHSNFGCATNSNLAAMIADPEDLVRGQTASGDRTATSNKAIKSYREADPTGKGGLQQESTAQGGGQ